MSKPLGHKCRQLCAMWLAGWLFGCNNSPVLALLSLISRCSNITGKSKLRERYCSASWLQCDCATRLTCRTVRGTKYNEFKHMYGVRRTQYFVQLYRVCLLRTHSVQPTHSSAISRTSTSGGLPSHRAPSRRLETNAAVKKWKRRGDIVRLCACLRVLVCVRVHSFWPSGTTNRSK